jgi:cupin 2 domain-containing protein
MNNIFDDIPEDLESEVFEELVAGEGVTIERIISKGQRTPGGDWYDQEKNEWVMVLSGEATLLFDDGISVALKAGDFINIEAHRKHRVEWTPPDVETIWLAVHY